MKTFAARLYEMFRIDLKDSTVRPSEARDAAMPHQTEALSPFLDETTTKTEQILRRVQGEFLEMPGLRLTEAQARRLWGLDTATCAALLEALIAARFLFRTRDGAYMRIENATPVQAKLSPRATGVTAA